MLSTAQLDAFLDDGAVTVDGPWSTEAIAAARAVADRRLPFVAPHHRLGETCSFTDPELVALIADPFFERVAAQVLSSPNVFFYQTALTIVHPQPPGTAWAFEQHVDITYSRADWEAVPRRIICSFFLWLSDVNERRAPMMLRPASHRLLATPRHRGPAEVAHRDESALPRLGFAEPRPLVARAGQVTVCTTAAVHGASLNVDDEARRALVVTFTAAGVTIGLPARVERERLAYARGLVPLVPPERAHVFAV